MGALRSLVRPLRSSVSGRAAVICLPVNFKRDYAAHRRRARKSRACVSTGPSLARCQLQRICSVARPPVDYVLDSTADCLTCLLNALSAPCCFLLTSRLLLLVVMVPSAVSQCP